MIRRNQDVINKGNELTGIKENIYDIEVNSEMKEIIEKAQFVKKQSLLKRPEIEKKTLYSLMNENQRIQKRYLVN